uniref:hypothetical protein n=1 Tax=Lentinus flexipes TaxID=3163629 RepID=UPI002263F934|nr:hypothetical protein OSR58_mgp52 [Ganoderma flexipes]UYX56909.1 hypothetical protein [Ganoderma flexipes]
MIIPYYECRPKLVWCSGKTPLWLKLSNSGDTLKLMIPSYLRKIISGQNNYLGMVTSHKMNENEMGYRGSKSANKAVKEQRVDGSWFLAQKARSLRYTLMGFERNYQVKIPSKQLNRLNYSTVTAITTNLNPNFVSGFTDA